MKAYLFPGQGSQYKGMGANLFDQFPDYTAKADSILGYSIKSLCLSDPDNVLSKTQFTQPALYVVSALSYLETMQENGVKPDFVAGHSLGEYNALFAAGMIDFETGLRLVKKRGELMSKASGGSMAAVLNCDINTIYSILKENNLAGIDIANFNSPKQIVLSGPNDEIGLATSIFKKAGATFIPLNVSAAFHSRYMQTASNEFSAFLNQFEFSAPVIPIISNLSACPYSLSDAKNNLTQQISHPVHWTDSIRYLLGCGVTEFKEIGPGNVLTKLVQAIQTYATPLVIEPKNAPLGFTLENLGSAVFKQRYNLRCAYITGAMVKGIASKEHVIRMGKAKLMGYYGAGGQKLSIIEQDIKFIQQALSAGESYGINLLSNLANPTLEMSTVDLFLRYGIKHVEAAAFIQLSPALVKYRLAGLARQANGEIMINHKVLAKVSRPEVADIFLNPAPERIVIQLLNNGMITHEQAELSKTVPMADDICVEADSGGHTDMGIVSVILPTIIRQRDEICRQRSYAKPICIGAAGGIGTPEAAAAAFVLGAEFIMTGSINQCTVDAGTSDEAKEMLAQMNVQDTDYAPAGDMFEIGAKIQVLRKGVFFPARANKLYELWCNHNAWEEIPEKTREQIETRYFGRSFDSVYQETKQYYLRVLPQEIDKAEQNPKHKLSLVFRWYFIHTARLALKGSKTDKVNYQIHTGPAMGAFNQWVKGTELEDWKNRRADVIADKLMHATAELLNKKFLAMLS
jgi:trans-AT polyketide synthase/acyltransferase/oxidoreductase domain-containing protein